MYVCIRRVISVPWRRRPRGPRVQINSPLSETLFSTQWEDSRIYTESNRACDKQVVAVCSERRCSVIHVPQAVTTQQLLQRLQLNP